MAKKKAHAAARKSPKPVAKPPPAKAKTEARASKPGKVVVEPARVAKAVKLGKRPIPPPTISSPTRRADGWMGPLPDKSIPRSTKLPGETEALTKREMEQVLTVGTRGVAGEGGLKGRVVVYQNLPYLEVIGRDKRELWFLLQGPDQEVFPAYVDHKVSVSGLIKRFHPYGGSVDVRKYTARKPDETVPEPPEGPAHEDAARLRLLSPGEVETLCSPGMSVGLKGFATVRGRLELSGDEFFLVVSNAGTRQQVAFTIAGKGSKGLKRYVGEVAVATGIVEKQTGWGGRIEAESCEPRAPEFPPVSRDALEITHLEVAPGTSSPKELEVKVNSGLVVKLSEKQGHVWAIEPQLAKRVSLREVTLHTSAGSAVREFFFTPRNPGAHEVDFFLGKLHNPMNAPRSFRLVLHVKAPEGYPA